MINKISNKFRKPIFILGNQKSGTSAIAALLGERTGVSYSVDLRDEIKNPVFHKVYADEMNLSSLISKNKKDFNRKIVKEPNLTFLYDKLRIEFPRAKFVMVIREPKDNLRSLLNRHQISGKDEKINAKKLKSISHAWKVILYNEGLNIEGKNHIEHMSKRWNVIAKLYLEHKNNMELITYEDFLKDKLKAIDGLAQKLNLNPVHDISKILDKPFQKPGKRTTDYESFFSKRNLKTIDKNTTCRKKIYG